MAMQETEAAPEAQPIDKLYMRTHFCVPPARCFAMTPSAIARSAIRSKYRKSQRGLYSHRAAHQLRATRPARSQNFRRIYQEALRL